MMAAVRSPHVDGTTELSGNEDEPHQDSGDSDAESDGRSDDGEHGMDGDEEDDDGSGASDMEKAEDEDKGNEEGGKESNPNAGWAEAMAKILQKKTPGSKPTILIKNKQLEKMKEKEKQERLEQREKVDKKREWEMMFRVKPDIAVDRDFERTLQRTATRGVVQLFNAVRKHQSTVDEKVKEVGSSERKKAKLLSSVTKKDFIDVLRGTGGGKAMTKAERNAVDDGEEEKPSWSVLKDDFMMGAAMKDWDKESDDEDSHQQTEEPIDDSDSD